MVINPLRTTRRRATRLPRTASPTGLGPDSLGVFPQCVRAGDGWVATLTVTGYPAQVGAGWLEPLRAWPGLLDIAVHVTPVAPAAAAARLRKQRARLESVRRQRARTERLDDPELDTAAADAAELAGRVAAGAGRLFSVALTLTVHARSRRELSEQVVEVRGIAASLLLDAHPTTWRAVQGYVTTLPLGLDLVGATRTLDTDALAACFPFASPDLPALDPARPGDLGDGVFCGLNAGSAGVVVADRWAQHNYNSVVLASSGAGKSYATKLIDVLRPLYQGVEVSVIDPEHEYLELADAVGGTVLDLGDPATRLNPLDLPEADTTIGDALRDRVLFCHTLIALLLGVDRLDAAATAALDRALHAAYTGAGISGDPRSWARPAPLLRDVREALDADTTDPAAGRLAGMLAPFTDGSFSHLFAGPTTTRPDGHLRVFALKTVPDELRPAACVLALDAVWRQVTDPTRRRRRIVVIDEGWQLMQSRAAGRYVFRLAKTFRRHWAGLTVVTQDVDDLLGSELGRAVVHNASSCLLLGQAPSAIDQVAEVFDLTDGETRYLLSAPVGCGLLIRGRDRVALQALASDTEHALITTDPAETTAT